MRPRLPAAAAAAPKPEVVALTDSDDDDDATQPSASLPSLGPSLARRHAAMGAAALAVSAALAVGVGWLVGWRWLALVGLRGVQGRAYWERVPRVGRSVRRGPPGR